MLEFKKLKNTLMNLNNYLSKEAFDALRTKDYGDVKPFPYLIIDNFLREELAEQILAEFPGEDDAIWWEYNNPLEKKFACDDMRKFPLHIAETIHALNHHYFVEHLQKLTGINDLSSDPYLHGGGLHSTRIGGKLDMHVDYGIHPKLHKERRLNLILYLTPREWKEQWGGELEFWSGGWNETKPYLTKQEVVIPPKFNRAVIFSTGDLSFHGHPNPLQCPQGMSRKSIALYYLSHPREGIMNRERARYVARPNIDPVDQETEEFREERSKIPGKYK